MLLFASVGVVLALLTIFVAALAGVSAQYNHLITASILAVTSWALGVLSWVCGLLTIVKIVQYFW